MAAVQLMNQYLIPRVFHSTVGAGQGEYIGSSCQHRAGAGLDGRRADVGETEPPEEFAKAWNILGLDPVQCFGSDIAPGQAGTTGGDHHIDIVIVHPIMQARGDHRGIVAQYGTLHDFVACGGDSLGENVAAGVVVYAARIGNRQQRDIYRLEKAAFIERQCCLRLWSPWACGARSHCHFRPGIWAKDIVPDHSSYPMPCFRAFRKSSNCAG